MVVRRDDDELEVDLILGSVSKGREEGKIFRREVRTTGSEPVGFCLGK